MGISDKESNHISVNKSIIIENEKFKKLNPNQDHNINNKILNIDGGKKVARMPSHSSNNSQESKERNDLYS